MPPTGHDATCQPAAVDEGLRCLSCDYNLTGLPGGACPECGAAFDPAALRAMLAGWRCSPVPIWDERKPHDFLGAWLKVSMRMWLSPRRFARAFPIWSDPVSTSMFRCRSHGLAVALVAVPAIITGRLTPSACALLMLLGIASARLCEGLLAELVFAQLQRTREAAHGRARNLAGFTSCYLPLWALAVAMTMLLSLEVWPAAALMAVAFAVWWLGITCLAWGSAPTRYSLTAGIVLTPLCALFSWGMMLMPIMLVCQG